MQHVVYESHANCVCHRPRKKLNCKQNEIIMFFSKTTVIGLVGIREIVIFCVKCPQQLENENQKYN